MKSRCMGLLALVLGLLPAVAWAHPHVHGSADHATGAWAGFMHPILGLDHVLAIVAVGLLAVQLGGKAIWALPATFIGAMVVGGAAGMWGVALPLVEMAILASVAIFGIAVATGRKLPLPVAMVVVGFFAIFHGHAHGTELPAVVSPALYAVGFVVGTALLLMTGVAGGLLARRGLDRDWLVRWAGGAIAAAAPLMLFLG
jgi:urease accessory protein